MCPKHTPHASYRERAERRKPGDPHTIPSFCASNGISLSIAPIQEERQVEDAWTGAVHECLNLALTDNRTVKMIEIGQWLGFKTDRFDMVSQKRIGSILRKAKWKRCKDSDRRSIWKPK
jgi:hypothetical protein